MKRSILAIIFFIVTTTLFSQPWMSLIPEQKLRSGTATFYDCQEAFNRYWAPYHVDSDGYFMENGKRQKAYGWKQFKRWEWEMMREINQTDGKFAEANRYIAWKEYQAKYTGASRDLIANWTSIGMSSNTGGYWGIGRLNCIAFHPSDLNTYWVGAPTGSMWVTTDDGISWAPLTDDLAVIGVSDIAIPTDYATSHTIYIATGDRDRWVAQGIGVLKSVDGGQTWNETGLTFERSSFYVNRLLIHPDDNTILYAATTDGVYRTEDSGTTWALTDSRNFIDMEFNPVFHDTLYASVKSGSDVSGVYRSLDAGYTWAAVLSVTGWRTEVAVSPDQPELVYAVVCNETGGLAGFYRSLDYGGTFSLMYDGSLPNHNLLSLDCDASGNRGQGSYDLCIAANPANGSEVYVGGINTWKSSNGGSSWEIVNVWAGTCEGTAQEVHADKHFLTFRGNTGTLYECNDGGLYRSSDGGDTWTDKSNGLVIGQIYRMDASTYESRYLEGHQDAGTQLFYNTWTNANGGDGMTCLFDPILFNTYYVSSQNGVIERHNGTITTISSNIVADSGAWTTPFMLNPLNHNSIYIGLTDLWKSTDQGDNFTRIYDCPDDEYFLAIAIASSDSNVICVSNIDHIFITTDGGSNWTNISNNLPLADDYIQSIEIKEDNPAVIWVALSGYDSYGVFETVNQGQSWADISAGLPAVPVNRILQNDMINNASELYAATHLGVFVKQGGLDWTPFQDGMPNVIVNDLDIYYSGANSKIRAGSWGRDLWETDVNSFEAGVMPFIWSGLHSTDWNVPENWAFHEVPGESDTVTIPAGRQHYPEISTGSPACNELYIDLGGMLTLSNFVTFTVMNDAHISGSVVFTGSGPQLVVHGELSCHNGADLAGSAANHTIKVDEGVRFLPGSIVDLPPGTLILTGEDNSSLTVQSSGISLSGLKIDKTVPGKTVDLVNGSTNDFTLKGNLEIRPDNTFNILSNYNIFISGIIVNAQGDLHCNLGALVFTGSYTSMTISPASYLNDLTINMASTEASFVILCNIQINGDMLLQQGEFRTTGHTVFIKGNWNNYVGEWGFTPLDGAVVFNGNTDQSINSDEIFAIIKLEKSAGKLSIISQYVICDAYDWSAGILQISGTAHFVAFDMIDNGIYGEIILNGGIINLTNTDDRVDLCGHVTINAGTFNVYGGNDDSYWPMNADASLAMSGGTLTFHDVGVYLFNNPVNTFTENITGGTIVVNGNFYGNSTSFTPEGGTIKLVGTSDVLLGHGSGSGFYDVEINKNTALASFGRKQIQILKSQSPAREITDANLVSLNSNTVINHSLILSNGALDLNSYMLTDYGPMDIYGMLKMTHSSDLLRVYGDLSWFGGSTTDISDGVIRARGDWLYDAGSQAQPAGLNLVVFEGTSTKNITAHTTGSFLNNVEIYKSSGNFLINAASTDTLIIKGNLTVKANNQLLVNSRKVKVSGDISIEQNGILNVTSGSVAIGQNDLDCAGTILQSGGMIKLNRDITLQSTAIYHPSAGSVEFIGSPVTQISLNSGNYFYDLIFNKPTSSPSYLSAPLQVNHDLTFTSGTLITSGHNLTVNRNLLIQPSGQLNPSNDTVTVKGNWTNNRGALGFEEGTGTVFLSGSSRCFVYSDETFYRLIIDKSFGPDNFVTLYNGKGLTVLYDFAIRDGAFLMQSNSSLLCNGGLEIFSGAGFNANPAATDVVIRCEGNWLDNNNIYDANVGFNPGFSQVIFQGGDVQVLAGGTNGETFYNLALQKSDYEFYPQVNITVLNDLDLLSGTWSYDEPGLVHTVMGDFTLNSSAVWDDNTGTIIFTGPADQNIGISGTGNTDFSDILVDKTTGTMVEPELVMLSDLNCDNLTVDNGVLSVNSNVLECSTFLNILSGGSVTAADNSVIKMGSGADLFVDGGLLVLSSSDPGTLIPVITHSSGNYAFLITNGGILDASDAIFEYMDVDGINVTATGSVTTVSALQRCTFRNGAAGGSLFSIANAQHLVMDDVDFPTNTWGGSYNVSKFNSTGGLVFNYATGGFAGPSYEQDPNARITWVGGGTWTGALSTYWTTPGNWWYNIVPDGLVDVYIPDSVPNMPSVNLAAAYCNTLTLEPLASLTVNLYDLHVLDYADIFGNLVINDFKTMYVDSLTFKESGTVSLTNKANIQLTDDLVFGPGSAVNSALGKFLFTGNQDSYIFCFSDVLVNNITNGKPAGYKLIIASNSTHDLDVHGTITNNGGGIFNIQSPNKLIIETAFDNQSGYIRADAGTIEFTGNAGLKTFKPNHGDYLKNLTIASISHLSLANDHSDSLQINGNLLIDSNAGGSSGLDANGMTILIKGEWRNNAGEPAFVHGNGRVIFTSSGSYQRIIGHTAFHILDEQTAGIAELRLYNSNSVENDLYVGHRVIALDTLSISGTLHLPNLKSFNLIDNAQVETAIFNQGGTLTATSGSFLANDIEEAVLLGTYNIQGADVTLTQDASSSINNQAIITISSGSLNISGGNGISNWPSPSRTASLTMTGGLLHISDQGILIQGNGFNENISGGTILTPKDFLINPGMNNFHPTGGVVEIYGTQDSHISMYPSACHFYDLKMNKNTASSVILDDSTYIAHELILESGTFNTNEQFISVGTP